MNTMIHWGGPILVQAMILGAIVCLVTLPFVAIIHYKKRGRLLGNWMWKIPLVIVYLVGVISFTFLPLPDPGTFQCANEEFYPRLQPGWSLQFAYLHSPHIGVLKFFTWYFVQIYLNVLLFVPFGFLARWIFKGSFRTTLFTAFGATLFIELSQLTGIWGYFDCRYRTFDVDDMITNVLGAIFGWLVATLISRRKCHLKS